jgi:hypothetical protein
MYQEKAMKKSTTKTTLILKMMSYKVMILREKMKELTKMLRSLILCKSMLFLQFNGLKDNQRLK